VEKSEHKSTFFTVML